jgi:hypothetical protein
MGTRVQGSEIIDWGLGVREQKIRDRGLGFRV